MADGSIVFDTELNAEGFNEGLEKLGNSSSASLKTVSDEVNRKLSEAFGDAASSIKDKTKAITDNAIALEKQYDSETQRIQSNRRDKEAEYVEYLKNNLDKIKGIRNDELKCLELSYELGIISTEEYFTRLEAFRDRYFLKGSAEWLNYTGKILEHNKKLANEQEKALSKAAERTAEDISDIFKELEKEREKLNEKLYSYGGISHKNRIVGEDIDIEYVSLAKIDKQNEQLEEYLRLMTEVRNRVDGYWRTDTGNPDTDEKNKEMRNNYFSQIRDMSVEDATDFARVISGTTDEMLKNHLAGFERKQELAEEISKTLYSTDVSDAAEAAAKKLGDDFSYALADELESLSGRFFSGGKSACLSFGEGFMSNLNKVLAELSSSVSAGLNNPGYPGIFGGGVSNVENNTSYNIYNSESPAETMRFIREKEELKKMMLD